MAVASLSAVHTGITAAQSDRAHQLLQQSAAIVDLIGASLEGDLLPAEDSVPFACAAVGDMLQELKGLLDHAGTSIGAAMERKFANE